VRKAVSYCVPGVHLAHSMKFPPTSGRSPARGGNMFRLLLFVLLVTIPGNVMAAEPVKPKKLIEAISEQWAEDSRLAAKLKKEKEEKEGKEEKQK
jgi:hypothetical protein